MGKMDGQILYVGVHKVAEHGNEIGIFRFSQLIDIRQDLNEAIDLARILNQAYEDGLRDGAGEVSWDWS